MHKEMYADSVLHDRERMLMYKTFATAFSYPDDNLFGSFSLADEERKELVLEYDRLFRANNIWLYGTEYKALNEFQRVQYLSDIMGFYRAFGLEPDRDRPDSLHIELEFMYYLIFKKLHALNKDDTADSKEKAFICASAQRKFFTEHLQPAAKKIAETIISKSKNSFYIQTANEMLEFLGSEEELFRRST